MPFALNLAAAFDLNYRGFLGSCFQNQFPVLIQVLEVQADVVCANSKQFRHLALEKPDRLVIGAELNLAPAVFRGVENQHGSSWDGKSCCISSFLRMGRSIHFPQVADLW